MKMDDHKRRCYLWKSFEKAAFRPRDIKDAVNWLNCYARALLKIWEVSDSQSFPINKKDSIEHEFNYSPLGLNYELRWAGNNSKYSIDIDFNDFILKYHADLNYFDDLVTGESLKDFNKNLNIALKEREDNDIDYILKGKIAHPAIHQHIEFKDERKDNDIDDKQEKNMANYIRIGTAHYNPFLFLYQFAFQLTDHLHDYRNSDLKKKEFNRIKKVFLDYLIKFKGKKPPVISPGVLFKI